MIVKRGSRSPVWVGVGVGGWVCVDECGGEFGNGTSQKLLGVACHSVILGEAVGGIDDEFGVGVQSVADSAHPNAGHPEDNWLANQSLLAGGHQAELDLV